MIFLYRNTLVLIRRKFPFDRDANKNQVSYSISNNRMCLLLFILHAGAKKVHHFVFKGPDFMLLLHHLAILLWDMAWDRLILLIYDNVYVCVSAPIRFYFRGFGVIKLIIWRIVRYAFILWFLPSHILLAFDCECSFCDHIFLHLFKTIFFYLVCL